MTSKLSHTETGDLIVYRVAGRKVYPTWTKARNALRKLPKIIQEVAFIEPVRVFPGIMDYERVTMARDLLSRPLYVAGYRLDHARKMLAKHGVSYPNH